MYFEIIVVLRLWCQLQLTPRNSVDILPALLRNNHQVNQSTTFSLIVELSLAQWKLLSLELKILTARSYLTPYNNFDSSCNIAGKGVGRWYFLCFMGTAAQNEGFGDPAYQIGGSAAAGSTAL